MKPPKGFKIGFVKYRADGVFAQMLDSKGNWWEVRIPNNIIPKSIFDYANGSQRPKVLK